MPAYVMAGSGEAVSYAQLDARSNQGAQLFRRLGLNAGDAIGFFLENHPRYYELLWAAQRAGLRYTCLSSKLSADEVEYIARDSGAKLFITSNALLPLAALAAPRLPNVRLFILGAANRDFDDLLAARDAMPPTPIADESAGSAMLYSSGTTGRPKGVKRGGRLDPDITAPNPQAQLGQPLYGCRRPSGGRSPRPAGRSHRRR